jgi:gas vesicle protein
VKSKLLDGRKYKQFKRKIFMESGKVVLGVLAGIAFGAALGILLAPEKGSVTRRQILNKGDDYANDLNKKLDSFMEALSKNYGGALQHADELSSKGKAKFEQLKKELANAAV